MTFQRVIPGDARELSASFSEGRQITCIATDPPYGVNFVSRKAATPHGRQWVAPISNDAGLDGAIALFDEVMDNLLPHCAPTAELYVFTRWDVVDTWIRVVRDLCRHAFAYKMLLVWDKGDLGMGDIDSNWGCGHELILYCKRGRRDVPYRRSSILAVDKVHTTRIVHPTEKPVALLEKLIEMSSDPGDLIVDPFAGSGSALVAAQRLGRDALGYELEDRYVKVINQRLSQEVMF